MRKKRTTPPSALTDIAFLLLLFFLIMAITSHQSPVPLNPAQTSAQKIDLKDIATLLVSQDGQLFLDGNPVILETLPSESTYALLADKNTPFSVLFPIIEYLREQGTETLHCLVEETP
jgi:biopolymer transport protein ExbD